MKHLLIFLLLTAFLNETYAQDKYVLLKDENVATVPLGYHISGIIDDRPQKDKIGTIDYGAGTGKLLLKDGIEGLMAFAEKDITRDITTRPIFLHIAQLDIKAKKEGDEWVINSDETLVFYASGYKLVEYTGKGHAQVSGPPEEYAERYIRKEIDNDLAAFNEWWPANKEKIVLSGIVRVNVSIGKVTDNTAYIPYGQERPLQIADFTGSSQAMGAEMAATMSGMEFSSTGTIESGENVINIVITPYFDSRQSWFKEEGKIPAVLAHEQAHFDITAIKACDTN